MDSVKRLRGLCWEVEFVVIPLILGGIYRIHQFVHVIV